MNQLQPNAQALRSALFDQAGVECWLLPTYSPTDAASGNKFFKLRDNLAYCRGRGLGGVITFGGRWSNHLLAVAQACRRQRLASIGIVCGDWQSTDFAPYPESTLTATLLDARAAGMQLRVVSRAGYRQRHDDTWLRPVLAGYPDYLLLPEGGSNLRGIQGCREIPALLPEALRGRFDCIVTAVGSGGTLAGLSLALQPGQQAIGYAVARDNGIQARVDRWRRESGGDGVRPQLRLVDNPRFGKLLADDWRFLRECWRDYQVLPDPVYSLKMLRALHRDVRAGLFEPGRVIIALHHGGLQGWRGIVRQPDVFSANQPDRHHD